MSAEEAAEYQIKLSPEAIAVEPLTVEVTGRDPRLVQSGFYQRRAQIEPGYFATYEQIASYRTLKNLVYFNRELTVRYGRDAFVLLDGRPLGRRGYMSLEGLNEIPLDRIRGIEAYPCNQAPPELMKWMPYNVELTECNLIAVWTR